MSNDQFVLASTYPPSVWNFFPARKAAAFAADEANAYNVKLEKHGAPSRRYEPMTLDEYQKAERTYWLSQPLQEITAERFLEMRDCLPPINWEHRDGVERFCMMEHTSGPYTSQYIACNGRYFQATVDVFDRSSWFGAKEIAAHCAPEGQGHSAREDERRIYRDAPEACR